MSLKGLVTGRMSLHGEGEAEEALDQKCEICGSEDDPDSTLLCDSCDGGFHTYCLVPAVTEVPEGEWHCPRCRKVKTDEAKHTSDEPFGFKDGPRYSLATFHTLADSFKSNWFGHKARDGTGSVPVKDIERDFWQLVEEGSLRHDVNVLYGNDLPTISYGSGFPTHAQDTYAKHKWNLNVMPTAPGSLLRHLEEVQRGERISGITAPWIYFGMLFSSFCWHTEDNYLYSINYMHWGEGKIWYAVPGHAAKGLEDAMREAMPELFAASPDLLFHITTMLSPRVLVDAGVPCYRLVQEHGNFVVTFPKAYHSGFSLGFNCGEAVNFASSDWLPWGADAMLRYRTYNHLAAFSIPKLLCAVAAAPIEELLQDGGATLQAVAVALEKEVQQEAKLRENFLGAGRGMALRVEHAPPIERVDGDEDGRICAICKQNCYFSFVACACDMGRNVCLNCVQDETEGELCACHTSRHIMFYQHELEELEELVQNIRHAAAVAAASPP